MRKTLLVVVLACLTALLASCAASREANESSIVTVDGQACDVDAAKLCQAAISVLMCQQIRSLPAGIPPMVGYSTPFAEKDALGRMTFYVHSPVFGGPPLEVECRINGISCAILHARYMPGTTPNKADLHFLQSNGYCKQEQPTRQPRQNASATR